MLPQLRGACTRNGARSQPRAAVLFHEARGYGRGRRDDLPYPPQTANFHHEIELIVAIGPGGIDIPVDHALDHVWAYGVGIDLTRRDSQLQAREQGRPRDWSKGFDLSGAVLFRQTGFWEHRPFKVKRSNGRAPGYTKSLQRVVARTAQVARSKLVERTGVQGFHLVTLHSASLDKAVVGAASIKWV